MILDQDIVLTGADEDALARIHAVRPVWRGVTLACDAMAFPDHTILHAGPPIRLDRVARPILNSAVMAALYEGWAADVAQAETLLTNGTIHLAPAQDHRVVVPLAAVLSPTMAVQVVLDAEDPANRVLSPLNGGMDHAQRLGLSSERVLAHLRWINGNLASMLTIIADRDVPLLDVAAEALSLGDDLHGRTTAASRCLIERLAPRLGTDTLERHFLDKAPGFFLNLWMAAVKCMARAGEGERSSLVVALGGNGVEVGLKLGGRPDTWITAPATPPDGPLDSGMSADRRLGAIGDSALVDAMGFGAMASAPPSGSMPRRHPAFRDPAIQVGLPARLIAGGVEPPRIALGILDRRGEGGRIGGGIYAPPSTLFIEAVRALS